MKKSMFISLEGSDGSGKSTQIALLKEFLEKEGYEVLITRDPGGTKISEKIREVILDPANKEMSNMTELLLYTAARAQLVDEVIRPALRREATVVISDRFLDSAAVYQGMVRGLGTELVYEMNRNALQGILPEVTFFLHLPAEEGIKRKSNQKELDRLEQEKAQFHERVVEGYCRLAKEHSERIITIDAMLPVTEIHEIMAQEIKKRLQ